MSALQGILREEYDRLGKLSEKYQNELKRLPKGSISVKEIRNNNYYYLAFRKKKKVIFKYLGKEDSIKLNQIEEQLRKRKDLELKLRQVNSDIKELSKSISE
ncbi:hypothetical protein ES705_05998 [subsurface metagenome]